MGKVRNFIYGTEVDHKFPHDPFYIWGNVIISQKGYN